MLLVWTHWRWDRFLSLSVSYHRCAILIYQPPELINVTMDSVVK